MKRVVFAVGYIVLTLTVAFLAQASARQIISYRSSMNTVQQLTNLEKRWDDAEVKHDWAFLDEIIATDYTCTDPDGIVLTKPQYLESLKSGESVVMSSITDDMRVREYGDAAVVTGRTTVKGQYKGKDMSGQYRWTDVWAKDYMGRWKCVADHSSRIIAQK